MFSYKVLQGDIFKFIFIFIQSPSRRCF